MTDPAVILRSSAGVATITLNAPDRLNAIDSPMGALLDRAFVDAGRDPEIKIIVVTGRGRGFCAGASVDRLRQLQVEGGSSLALGLGMSGDSIFDCFEPAPPAIRSRYVIPLALPKPVIAAVKGPCAGAGLILALACDIRIAHPAAKFVASFVARGLIAEGLLPLLLPRIVGAGLATDMLLSARPIEAEEALRVGLVTQIISDQDFEDGVQAYARSIAEIISPMSASIIKRQLGLPWQHELAPVMVNSNKELHAAFERPDFREGLSSFSEKRLPRFASIPQM